MEGRGAPRNEENKPSLTLLVAESDDTVEKTRGIQGVGCGGLGPEKGERASCGYSASSTNRARKGGEQVEPPPTPVALAPRRVVPAGSQNPASSLRTALGLCRSPCHMIWPNRVGAFNRSRRMRIASLSVLEITGEAASSSA